jgi:hypothetical protein
MPEFKGFPKIPRLEKFISGMIVTEKIDGTNGCIVIQQLDLADGYEAATSDPAILGTWTDQDDVTWGISCQSRNRTLTLDNDNYGFCRWVYEHGEELQTLGHGYHYGEWWGNGIQRNYELDEKRFSLFNVNRPPETLPECCHQVPVLYKGEFSHQRADILLESLRQNGSAAAPGFMDPEGIMLYLPGVRQYVKHPYDPKHKGQS